MNKVLSTLLIIGVSVAALLVVSPAPAQADHYWDDYWHWYDDSYTPYYADWHRHHYDPYADYGRRSYDEGYYNGFYDGYYRRPRVYNSGGRVRIGPIRIGWH